jgi:hypothetical protein
MMLFHLFAIIAAALIVSAAIKTSSKQKTTRTGQWRAIEKFTRVLLVGLFFVARRPTDKWSCSPLHVTGGPL